MSFLFSKSGIDYSKIEKKYKLDKKLAKAKQKQDLKIEKLKVEWTKDHEPAFDLEYLTKHSHDLDKYNAGVYSSGLEKIKKLDSNVHKLYVSEHLSEQDFFEEPKLFMHEKMRFPATFGGINLLVWGLTQSSKLVDKPLIIDMKKCGLIGIDRPKLKGQGTIETAYKRHFIEFLLGSKEKSSIFDRYDTLIYNSGRSKDGKIRNFDFQTLDYFHKNSLAKPENNYVVIPVCISLERVVEDASFGFQKTIKESKLPFIDKLSAKYEWAKKTKDWWKKHADKLGAIGDMVSFASFYFKKQPKGEVYIDFGEPINPQDFSKKDLTALKEEITNSINNMIRVTPTNAVAHILKYHNSRYIGMNELVEKVQYFKEQIPKSIPLSQFMKNETNEEIAKRGIEFLSTNRFREAVKQITPFSNIYHIDKESSLIDYYSNRIEHYNLLR